MDKWCFWSYLVLFDIIYVNLMCCFLPVSPFHPHCAQGLFTAEHDLVAGYLQVAMGNMRSDKLAGCFKRSLFSNGTPIPYESHCCWRFNYDPPRKMSISSDFFPTCPSASHSLLLAGPPPWRQCHQPGTRGPDSAGFWWCVVAIWVENSL